MKTTLTVGLVALLLAGLTGPGLAQAPRQSRDADKNQMKVLGAGLAVSALDALSRGRGGDALLLGAGAAYAGKKYEDARKAQSREWYGDDPYRERSCPPREYLRDRFETRWEREQRERREREERERWERLQQEREERERRERWERARRQNRDRDRCDERGWR